MRRGDGGCGRRDSSWLALDACILPGHEPNGAGSLVILWTLDEVLETNGFSTTYKQKQMKYMYVRVFNASQVRFLPPRTYLAPFASGFRLPDLQLDQAGAR